MEYYYMAMGVLQLLLLLSGAVRVSSQSNSSVSSTTLPWQPGVPHTSSLVTSTSTHTKLFSHSRIGISSPLPSVTVSDADQSSHVHSTEMLLSKSFTDIIPSKSMSSLLTTTITTVSDLDSHTPFQTSTSSIPISITASDSDSHTPLQTLSSSIPISITMSDSHSHTPFQTSTSSMSITVSHSDSYTTPTSSIPMSKSVSDSHVSYQSTSVPSTIKPPSTTGGIPLNYRLILYIVPALACVILLLIVIALVLCIRRYRRMRRYGRQLIPLTDRDGSDESDDEEEMDDREPAFMVTPMTKPILSFAST